MTNSLHFYIGLDLGQRANHSAISVLDIAQSTGTVRDRYSGEMPTTYTLRVRSLTRIALGTPYPDVMQMLRNCLNRIEVRGRATLIVDAGGPGLPFLDFLNAFPLNRQPHPLRQDDLTMATALAAWQAAKAYRPQLLRAQQRIQ